MTTTNICAFLWIIFGLVWLMASLKTKRTHERELFSSRLLYGIPIGIGSYLTFSKNLPFAGSGLSYGLERLCFIEPQSS